MLHFIRYAYLASVLIAFICSLNSFRLHYSRHLRFFSIFLGITAVTEIVANFLVQYPTSNYPVYNLFILIQYPMIAWYYRHIISDKKTRQLLLAFIVLYPVFWLSIFLFVYTFDQWCTYGIMLGDLFIVIFSSRYIYELITSENPVQLQRHPEFWISVGLLFFCACELPITGIINFLVQDWLSTWQLIQKIFSILQLLNILMYLMFTYAFLCRETPLGKKL
jgi:hypothetical protein